MKKSKKILLAITVFLSFTHISYANTGTGDQATEKTTNNIVQDALDKRKEELNKVLEKSQEEKDLDYVQ